MAKTAIEVIQEMKAYKQGGNRLVNNWSDYIHSDTKWFPGSRADPKCQLCEGMGYVRFDLPLGNPNFGKIFECECVVGFQSRRGANAQQPT